MNKTKFTEGFYKLVALVKVLPVSLTFSINSNGDGFISIINNDYSSYNCGKNIFEDTNGNIEDLIDDALKALVETLKQNK